MMGRKYQLILSKMLHCPGAAGADREAPGGGGGGSSERTEGGADRVGGGACD